MRTRHRSARRAGPLKDSPAAADLASVGGRERARLSAVGVAAAIGLAAVPGTASAAPSGPQLSAAQQAADHAAAQVTSLLEQAGAAQTAMADANAEAARALQQYAEKQQAAQHAQAAADAASAAAQKAQADLAAAKNAVARFGRESYMAGTTAPGVQSLLTAAGP